jgi:dihydrofolate reductase
MRRLSVFENVSIDGFFADAKSDMSWAHKHDDEWNAFAGANAGGDGALLFGRVTYQMMAGFWPTPQAAQMLPDVAAGMKPDAEVRGVADARRAGPRHPRQRQHRVPARAGPAHR